MKALPRVRSTTVIAVIRDGRIAMASDGQVTVGSAVMKQGAHKARKAAGHAALIGFAGGAADAECAKAVGDASTEPCKQHGLCAARAGVCLKL